MSVNRSLSNHHLHKTSVDAAKSQHTTIFSAGQKRTHTEFQQSEETASEDPAKIVKFHRPIVLTRQDACLSALKAGGIYDVGGAHSSSDYLRRKAIALSPNPTSDPLLDLANPAYGLPHQLTKNLDALGIKSIYAWQSDCLLRSGALGGSRNLVYTAPTGGGKSLVADILMLKKVIETPGKKAILVLPYVALVQEKLRWLRNVVEGIIKTPCPWQEQRTSVWRKGGNEGAVRVVGLFGGSKTKVTWADWDVAICTIEKANSLVNAAIEDRTIDKLGVVVMDELHMLDDGSRGFILEMMATKLLSLEQDVQLIGMSATLSNAEILAAWLNNAKFYISQYRAVPVEEHLVFDNCVYDASSSSLFLETAAQLNSQTQPRSQIRPEASRLIEQSESKELSNPVTNAVVSLANETARAGYGALVFCSSRMGCEKTATLISQVLPRSDELDRDIMEKRRDLLNDLRNLSTGIDQILVKTVPVGVAFHHAGLTTEERDLVATAYDQGVIKVIVATCSLAAGINLPARRVILHGARMGADLVGPSMLRQMRGRAGRKGKDEVGETYLCCKKSDLDDVAGLLEAEIPHVKSCLLSGKCGIKRALLEVIATRLATSEGSLQDYMNKTLLCRTVSQEELVTMVRSTLRELEESGLIKNDKVGESAVTPLGQAIVVSSLSPEDGIFVHGELRKVMQAFVMDGEMHVLYIFTPVQAAHINVNWQIFRQEVDGFNESNLRALGFVGLKPMIINKMAQGGTMKESTPQEIETARIYKRFYAALQLRDLCNEMPIHAVARKYDMPRGLIQNLASSCHGFAAGMIKFCQRMDWGALAAVLDHYSDRLKAGAKADLLALAEVTYIKSRTARIFWDNGFKTVATLASAGVNDILPVLLMAQPRKPHTEFFSEEKFIEKLRVKAQIISHSANKIWERQMQLELESDDEGL